jgi:hypothetical protein
LRFLSGQEYTGHANFGHCPTFCECGVDYFISGGSDSEETELSAVNARNERSRISTKPHFGEKLSYAANHVYGLQVFLSNGAVGRDSNIVERDQQA